MREDQLFRGRLGEGRRLGESDDAGRDCFAAYRLTEPQRKLLQDTSHAAQVKVRQLTESVDNPEKAKELLEPKGMTVNSANVEAFRKLAQEKVWPAYKQQFPELWEEIVATKV